MRKRWWLAAAMSLSGCTPLGLLNAVVIGDRYDRSEGLAYGEHPRQKLDVYVPEGAAPGAPVVVFLYGGRWQSGSREDYRFVAEALTSRGFVTVIPDTRLYPEVVFPAFVEDAAAAVQWTAANIGRFGGDAERLTLMGHSSGAHMAAMVALDDAFMQRAGGSNRVIDGMVGLAGPYDFLPFTDADIRALMGPESQWPATQPINFVDADDPPMLLLHGENDTIARPGNSVRLAEALEAKGVEAELTLLPGIDHYEIVAAMAKPLRGLAPVLEQALTFLENRGVRGESS